MSQVNSKGDQKSKNSKNVIYIWLALLDKPANRQRDVRAGIQCKVINAGDWQRKQTDRGDKEGVSGSAVQEPGAPDNSGDKPPQLHKADRLILHEREGCKLIRKE